MLRKFLISATAVGLAFTLGIGAAQADGELNLYIWADSISPDLIKQFEAETGVDVNVDSFSSNEDALTKLQAGSSGYDIITPSQHFVKIMIDSDLLQDVGAHELDAYQQINESWRNQWWDPNNDYSIPLAYRAPALSGCSRSTAIS